MLETGDPRSEVARLIWHHGVQRHLHAVIYWCGEFHCPLFFHEGEPAGLVDEQVVGLIGLAVREAFELTEGQWLPVSESDLKPRAWVHLKGTSEWLELEVY